MTTLWVSEHGRIYKGLHSETQTDGNLYLAERDFESMLALLDDAEESDLNPIFKRSRLNGRDVLTVQQYVGVVNTESGAQIEILPKISKETSAEQARTILVKMLVELTDSPFRQGVLSNLDAHKMPLFELLMRQFLDLVGDIVRKGIARTYVEQQDDLIFLRGKLQLTEHIKRNAADRSRLYCEFDEYEINRPVNRLIKGALETVSRLSHDAVNQQLCREFLFWFDRVPATKDHARDFRSVRHDRLIRHYQPALPICRLILEGLNPLTRQGETRVMSMLFPMSTVFENYVVAKLGSQFPGWSIKAQVSRHSLVRDHSGSSIFRLKPDLEFSQIHSGARAIGDTKWKLIDQRDRQDNYGISQGDVYQLFAYAKKYLADQPRKEAMLIYPMTDRFVEPLEPFWFENDEVLYVLPYDLEEDRLAVQEDALLFLDGVESSERVAA